MKATLQTNKGNIIIEFFDKETPNTVANFIKLAQTGFYDGVKFHRVIKNFMIQSGDPLTKDDTKTPYWGSGGPGYKFDDEITPGNSNSTGTISMANAGRNTNGSQFFINLRDNHYLNPNHTVFGRVTEGMEVAQAIEMIPTGPGDRPVQPVVINHVLVEE
jgi:cyclophilin family peptidyl-prolyl cis-trans isomerase